jgi:hypothetical protein
VKRPALWTALAVVIPIAALFGPALVTDRSFAMRDAGHFYYPLFEWCCREWAAGRVPLWNPQENCGMPVLADATSSVFYPGKLLFALPLDFALLYKLYIVGHVVLAAAFSYLLARAWKASHAAAALAAISYSCGGNVVFQYCNVVFLVGAAWLPLAALAADRMLRGHGWKWSVLLGVCLAMMILGGDPEAAYHALFICAIYAVVLIWPAWLARGRREPPGSADLPGDLRPPLARMTLARVGMICLAACVGFLLSAVQVIPSAEATRLSDRAAFDRPRNIYECGSILLRHDAEQPLSETTFQSVGRGLFGRPPRGSHHEQAFDFSVGPWRLAEYLWPNIAGRMFPTNRRWLSLLPGEGRTWTPTLYLGLLPAVFALASLRFWTGNRRQRWLTWLVLIFTVASFGIYGLGWLANEILSAIKARGEPASNVAPYAGGLYWLFVTLLPAYVYFRYPAKLLPIVSLGITQLAAIGFDRAFAQRRPRFERFLLGLAIISMTGAAVVWLTGLRVLARFAHIDVTIGPFDAAGAYHDVLVALGQTTLVAVIARWLLRHAWQLPSTTARWQFAALLLTAADLAFANYWLVVTAPADLWRIESPLAAEIRASERPAGATTSLSPRVYRGNLASWRPITFALIPSTDRMAELARWEHDTLFPKHELPSGLSLVEAYGSIKLADYTALLAVARQHGPRQPDKTYLPQPTALRLLGTEFLILPDPQRPDFARRIDGADPASHEGVASSAHAPRELIASLDESGDLPEDAALWRMDRTLPRAWIVHALDVETIPSLQRPLRTSQIYERTEAVLFPAGKPRDFLQSAVVETETNSVQPYIGSVRGLDSEDTCEITHHDPQRVVIEVSSKQPVFLILGEAWYPGWKAFLQSDRQSNEVPIERTNRVFRGVRVSGGKTTVEFRYEPRSFYLGAWISGLSWLLLAFLALFAWARRRGVR